MGKHIIYKAIIQFIFFLGICILSVFPDNVIYAQTANDWYMAGANPQRTSWVAGTSNEVRGDLQVEWSRSIEPFIEPKVQVIVSDGKLFVSTAKGLYAFKATDGTLLWTYGTELPLGNSPTYANGIVYVGGYDHRIHAINATDGKLKSGWTFVEAGGGFETNPLVINGKVYAGNRDGYMYALDANDGHLIWKWQDQDPAEPQKDGAIRFSAAYKNGVLYFASDNVHAYAIRDNGTSASLVWKSAKFPGVGFPTYWPVIYTDSTSGKDYVIFSGSKKADWGWFCDGGVRCAYFDTYDMFSTNGCTDAGKISYLWVNGTPTMDCGVISNYYQAKKWQRTFFVLDVLNGQEYTPYAPINYSGATYGGAKHPPIVGGDGVLYTFVGYSKGGNGGAKGWISGWKFGTPYISRIYDPCSGASDEPVASTGGGNLIYWGEGVNADTFGTIDISKPLVSGSSCASSSNMWKWSAMSSDSYTDISLGGKFGGSNGVYSYFNGVTSQSPIPYNNKLYIINGNTLFALSTTGGSKKLAKAMNPVSQPVLISTTPEKIKEQLRGEVQKMLDAGALRPGYHDSGGVNKFQSGAYDLAIPGDHLPEYFHNPSDTVITLANVLALPQAYALPPDMQTKIKDYIRNNYGPGRKYDVTKYASVGWNTGAKREISDDTPEMISHLTNDTEANSYTAFDPRTCIWTYNNMKIATSTNTNCNFDGGFPPDSFYGAWKYSTALGLTQAEVQSLFDSMKGKLSTAGTGNDMTNANLTRYPYILNQYLMGYRGYMELEKLAGSITSIDKSSKYSEYNRLLDLRLSTFNKNTPISDTIDYNNVMNVGRNFMYMTPELATEFRTHKLTQVQEAVAEYETIEPYWFVAKYDRTYGEAIFHHLYDIPALFQTKAHILKVPFSQLIKNIDQPAFYRGDLFYIQNLTTALTVAANEGVPPTAAPTQPCPKAGDTKQGGICDNMINISDYSFLSRKFGKKAGDAEYDAGADLIRDDSINILDYGILSKNFGL